MSAYEDDWFGPKRGLLSRTSMADELGLPPSQTDAQPGLPQTAPLPPRRPADIDRGADLPWQKDWRFNRSIPRPMTPYEKEVYDKMQQHNSAGRERFEELKRDYPHGAGYPENSPSFPNAGPQFNIKQIDEMIGRPSWGGEESFADQTKPGGPLPREFRPQREIPLGEIQRRWGVPRLEDL
jgi:hypothetical protein